MEIVVGGDRSHVRRKMNFSDLFGSLDERLKVIEERFSEVGYGIRSLVQSEIRKRWTIQPQAETLYGVYTGLVVDTMDYWGESRVRWFSPLFHKPNSDIKALPWAHPIASLGGFGDCGGSWIPPAGSTIAIVFENGNIDAPFYLGTIWTRTFGKNNWLVNVDEYFKMYDKTNNGYLVGANDGTQSFAPWNTENYNKFDIDSIFDFLSEPNAEKKMTAPHIRGTKTPEKHMWKNVDGDYKCNYRGKRIEIMSSLGNWFCMKDDLFYPSGYWGNPKMCSQCPADPSSENSNSWSSTFDCEDPKECVEDVQSRGTCKNPFFKHSSEGRPLRGPGTPQNNKCALPQVGIQLLSHGGTTLVMDDSVEEPRGDNSWQRSLQCFDFGCTNLFTGKTFWMSATGHEVLMNDKEEKTGLRGEDNGIRFLTANGNMIFMRDHTVGQEGEKDCGPNVAGDKRGILFRSTSMHEIEMNDGGNEQCGPSRKSGGVAKPKAKKAFISIRSGYGLEISLNDFDRDQGKEGSQQETINQNIKIFCPQRDNTKRGPHILRFQEVKDGPGQVLLNVGGDYICNTYDNHITQVGSEENPGNMVTAVSKDNIVQTKQSYRNEADQIVMFSEKQMFLLSGRDCPPAEGSEEMTPCTAPVLCLARDGRIVISDRVFVTASPDAQQASVFSMKVF